MRTMRVVFIKKLKNFLENLQDLIPQHAALCDAR